MGRKQKRKEPGYSVSSILTIFGTFAAILMAVITINDKITEAKDLRSEIVTIKNENENLHRDNERLRQLNERSYQLVVGQVKDKKCSIEDLRPFFEETFRQDRQMINSTATQIKSNLPHDNLVHGPLVTTNQNN